MSDLDVLDFEFANEMSVTIIPCHQHRLATAGSIDWCLHPGIFGFLAFAWARNQIGSRKVVSEGMSIGVRPQHTDISFNVLARFATTGCCR
jgi:hypothetical protein